MAENKLTNISHHTTEKLLNLNPDPIAKFILMKEFCGLAPDDPEYQSLYAAVCAHPNVRKYTDAQNERGFWPPFHGYTEGVIRKLLSFGLDKNHESLRAVSDYLLKVLRREEDWEQYEKQDHPLWWPEMFVPLVCAAMLSLIDSEHPALQNPREQWSYIARESFADGRYDREKNIAAIKECFGVATKRPIPPFNYYSLLLLAPHSGQTYLDADTDQALVDFCMNEAEGVTYVYNNPPGKMIGIDAHNRDSRDFWHWIRALSIIAQYRGWSAYSEQYSNWILSQRNADGLWEFPKKFDFTLSNAWRGRSKAIDSTIFVLKMLNGSRGF